MTETVTTPNHVHHGFGHESNSKSNPVEWYTPKSIFDALGLVFDLDPCSPGEGLSFVPARKHLTVREDGLATPWDPDDLVFLNPPYGALTAPFLTKLAHHPGGGVALLFARTDPKWFSDCAPLADVICFVTSRIRFYRGNLTDQAGSPGAGSMLMGYGPVASAAVRGCGLGVCLEPSGQEAA